MDEEQQVRQELAALVKVPGALKIITSEVQPHLRVDPKDAKSLLNEKKHDPDILKAVSTFVLHDVVRLEEIEHRGVIRAWSAEGDWTEGKPGPLLKRLREHRG